MDSVTATEKAEVSRHVTRCRICRNSRLDEFWDGGPMRIVEFPKMGEEPKKPRVPLRLAVCQNCWLVQLTHSVAPEYLYEEFWYRSGTNEQMRMELKRLADAAIYEARLKKGDWVLDIGCNDGTLLEAYDEELNLHRVGVDPAKNLGIKPTSWTFVNDYFSTVNALKASDCRKYKAITCAAMFYDLDDPVDFTKQMAECLDKDGVLIVQMNYLHRMIEACAVDNICHEHLTYFSLDTLKHVFWKAGLSIYHAVTNDVNGGSICVFACLNGKRELRPSIGALLGKEATRFNLRRMETYDLFSQRVSHTIQILDNWLDEIQVQKHKAYAYGASTRGITLLQLLNSKGKLIGVAERNPEKFGRYMVGADLPIVSEEEFRKNADVALVLPYHFINSIYKREAEWLKKGGLMLVPLPVPRVLEWTPYGVDFGTAL